MKDCSEKKWSEDEIYAFSDNAIESISAASRSNEALIYNASLTSTSVEVRMVTCPENRREDNVRCFSLGKHKLPNQTRTHRHSRFDYRWETRSYSKKVFASVEHNEITVDDVREAVHQCLEDSITGAIIVAVIFENPSAGLAALWPLFKGCLINKGYEAIANTIRLKLWYEDDYGCWKYHC